MKVSVSKLKTFVDYEKGSYFGYYSRQDVIDMIKGLKKDTYEQNIGTLVDAFIMDQIDGKSNYKEISEKIQKFIPAKSQDVLLAWCNDFKSRNKIIAAQVEKLATYDTILGPCDVSMRLDLLIPANIVDIKTSKYHLTASTYMDDTQAKFYTDAFDVDKIEFHHFWVSHSKTGAVVYDGSMLQYRSGKEECLAILNRFLVFVRRNNLVKYLNPKEMTIKITPDPEKPESYEAITLNERLNRWHLTKNELQLGRNSFKYTTMQLDEYCDKIREQLNALGIISSISEKALIIDTQSIPGILNIID